MVHRPVPRKTMPTFDSIEEARDFWDAHDTTEFEDEWQPADIEVVGPPRHRLSLTFDSETLRRVLALARKQGVGPTESLQALAIDALDRAQTVDPDGSPNEATRP